MTLQTLGYICLALSTVISLSIFLKRHNRQSHKFPEDREPIMPMSHYLDSEPNKSELPGINRQTMSVTVDKDWIGTPEKAQEICDEINTVNTEKAAAISNIVQSLKEHKSIKKKLSEEELDYFSGFVIKNGKIVKKPSKKK